MFLDPPSSHKKLVNVPKEWVYITPLYSSFLREGLGFCLSYGVELSEMDLKNL
jgi:hypothetical protein